jgi:hypothetical protein
MEFLRGVKSAQKLEPRVPGKFLGKNCTPSDLKRVTFDRNSDLKSPLGGRAIAGSEPKPVGAEIAGRRAIVGAGKGEYPGPAVSDHDGQH